MLIQLCLACRGAKTIKGLGSINKKCDTCKGIGHVSIELITEKELEKKPKSKKLQDAKNGKQASIQSDT